MFLCSTRFLFLQKCPLDRTVVPPSTSSDAADAQAEDEGLECQAAKEAAMLTVEQVMKERETVPGGPVVPSAQWCPVVPVASGGQGMKHDFTLYN